MKVKRKILEINEDLCNGCGLCVKACSEGAIQIIDGKAKLVAEKYCDGLGACIGECPSGAINIIEREAEEFDAEAVEGYLETLGSEERVKDSTLACGCPSSYVQGFKPATIRQKSNEPVYQQSKISALTHWPIQIRLIPPAAPFLKNAHLLVAADCTCVTLPNLHEVYLPGKTIMIGCPKFDDPEPYIQKFADIFRSNSIKEISALVMEVPCCQGLPVLIKKGMEMAGKDIPLQKIVINTKGNIIQKEQLCPESPLGKKETSKPLKP